jgi:peptide/nickel transport system permease protein
MRRRERSTWIALGWIALVALWAASAHGPQMDLDRLLRGPRIWTGDPSAPLLGADAFGRSLLPTLGEAMRRSLLFAIVATLAAASAGVALGSAIGLSRGRARFLSERALDFLLAFPPMLLALGVQAAIGTGWRALGFSVTVGLVPGIVRYVASRAKEISVAEYVSAAEAIGGSSTGIFWRHYRPALLEHLRLKLPSLIAQALLLEATLSFLNLGVQPGVLSWGALLAQGKDYLIEAPHIAWVVGLPLVLTLLAFQRLADDAAPGRRASLG